MDGKIGRVLVEALKIAAGQAKPTATKSKPKAAATAAKSKPKAAATTAKSKPKTAATATKAAAANTGMKNALGRAVFRGPKGGLYAISSSGKKVYNPPMTTAKAAPKKAATAKKATATPAAAKKTKIRSRAKRIYAEWTREESTRYRRGMALEKKLAKAGQPDSKLWF